MKTKTSVFYGAFCLSLLLGSAISLQAWTSPTGTPPANDAPAPINVSATTQTKAGGLVTTGFRSLLDAFFDGPVVVGTTTVPSQLSINGGICLNNDCLESWPVSSSISCPPGEFLRGIDANGKPLCEDPVVESEYYFGGMYGDTKTSFYNPLAGGTKGCPTGYVPYRFLGTYNVDYGAFVCIGLSSEVSKVAEFGGMYGEPSGSYTNPLTGGKNCPTGYTSHQILGKTNVDYNLYYCYTTNLSIPVQDEFYGVSGGKGNGVYENVVTGIGGSGSCANIGANAKVVLGTYNVDHTVWFCWK